jgi:hypothetical protein
VVQVQVVVRVGCVHGLLLQGHSPLAIARHQLQLQLLLLQRLISREWGATGGVSWRMGGCLPLTGLLGQWRRWVCTMNMMTTCVW